MGVQHFPRSHLLKLLRNRREPSLLIAEHIKTPQKLAGVDICGSNVTRRARLFVRSADQRQHVEVNRESIRMTKNH